VQTVFNDRKQDKFSTLLIGSWGLNLETRKIKFSDPKFRIPKAIYVEGTCPLSVLSSPLTNLHQFIHEGQRFAILSLGEKKGLLYWYAYLPETSALSKDIENMKPDAVLSELKQVSKNFSNRVQSVIKATRPEDIQYRSLKDFSTEHRPEMISGWNIAMVGDSAHLILPDFHQDKGFAVESGAMLGAFLGSGLNLQEALESYQRFVWSNGNELAEFSWTESDVMLRSGWFSVIRDLAPRFRAGYVRDENKTFKRDIFKTFDKFCSKKLPL